MYPGSTYSFSLSSVNTGNPYDNSMAIYIDYNRNGVFTDAGEKVYAASANTFGPHTETGTFTIPATAALGLTKMRVICNTGLITSPTQSISSGEYEEYSLNIGGFNIAPLPSGVTASWANNIITISGTPTKSGTFNYSIPLSGGCGSSINATGTITVSSNNAAGPASSTPTLCMNTPLVNITHTTTSATGIGAASNLPAGVTASWANNTITISGTPTVSGTFNYAIPLTGGCGSSLNATGTITVTPIMTATLTTTLPIDLVPNASLALGLRKLRSAYTGAALRLRRSSDNQQQDFGFAANNLDVNAISTWLNGASGYCTKVYDQSGNGGNVEQTNAAAQPLLVLSGLNNKPILRFTTNKTMFNNVNYPAPFSVIYGSSVIGTSARVLSTKNNNWLLGYWGGNEDEAFFEGWVNESGISTVLNQYNVYAATGTGSESALYKNGVQIVSNGEGLEGPNGIQLNGSDIFGEFSDCEFTDVIIYGSALSAANITQLNDNNSSYYTNTNTNTNQGNSTTLLINTPLTNIIFSTTRATGIGTATSLPAGVTASWANNIITISGTPTQSGTFNYSIPLIGGCGNVSATGTIIVNQENNYTTLNLTAYLEGFYIDNGTMRANLYDLGISTNDTETDSVEVNLWSATNLSAATPDYSVKTIIHTNGTIAAVFPSAILNNDYYVALKHRNSMEVWSAEPVNISSTSSYDFSTSMSTAYTEGFNDPMKWLIGNKYAMYGGDVNQDGTVDVFDAQITDNGAANLLFGYDASDCNGDGSSDLFDLQLIDNNSTLLLFYSRPF
jgi:hypothetical protein